MNEAEKRAEKFLNGIEPTKPARSHLLRYILLILGIIIACGSVVFLTYTIGKHFLKPPVSNVSNDPVDSWAAYIDPQNTFTILLPKQAEDSTEATPEGVHYAQYKAEEYFVWVFPTSSGIDFDKIVQHIVNSAGGDPQLIYSDRHQDSSGGTFLDFKITNSTQFFRGRMFLSGENIYVLLNTSLLANPKDHEFNNFLSSFQLNK